MKTIPISEARAQLTKLVEAIDGRYERVTLTVGGRPKAVLMSSDEFDEWQETLEILSDPITMKDLHEAELDVATGRVVSHENLIKELKLDEDRLLPRRRQKS